jgi:hypothetical protein
MTVPGSSVVPCEINETSCGTVNSIWFVLPSCTRSPLTHVRILQSARLTRPLGTTHGPSGRNVSKHLPRTHWPPPRLGPCHRRAVTSLAIVKPAT